MSGSNAVSGITIVGAIIAAGVDDGSWVTTVLGTAAVTLAMINVVGGYFVTDRMLGMFKKKDGPAKKESSSLTPRSSSTRPISWPQSSLSSA